jgi:hypothetical protein
MGLAQAREGTAWGWGLLAQAAMERGLVEALGRGLVLVEAGWDLGWALGAWGMGLVWVAARERGWALVAVYIQGQQKYGGTISWQVLRGSQQGCMEDTASIRFTPVVMLSHVASASAATDTYCGTAATAAILQQSLWIAESSG